MNDTISKETAQELAEELTNVKRQLGELQAKEIELKEKLKPYLKEHVEIHTNSATIKYKESQGAMSFNKQRVLGYIQGKYGTEISEDVEKECSIRGEPKQIVYVYLR